MKVFRAHENIPAVAITYAGRCDSYQPIILTSQSTELSPWVITAVSVTIVRDWSISRATIALTAKIGDDKKIPPLPDLSTIRGGRYPYLMEEDEIRIYAGYLDNSSSAIGKHLLDEHPFTVPALDKEVDLIELTKEVGVQGLLNKSKQDIVSNPNKPLAPIFWGFIDQIQIKGDHRAISCVLQCRDRMRVLHDTKTITLGTLQSTSREETITTVGNAGVSTGKVGVMSNLIIEAANTAAGQGVGYGFQVLAQSEKDTTSDICWKPIVGGDLPIYIAKSGLAVPPTLFDSPIFSRKVQEEEPVASEETTNTETSTTEKTDPNEIYMLQSTGLGAMNVNPWIGTEYSAENYPSDPTLWIKHASMKKINPFNIPRFHIWSERAPLQGNGVADVFTVTNKTPANIIIELSQIETLPTDVFCSHVNGDFIYGPRIIDTTGFEDEQRNYRTYFFMTYDKEIFTGCPLEAQRILKLDVASSSLGVFNTLYVLNGQTSNTYTDFIDRLVLYIKSSSAELEALPSGELSEEQKESFYGKGRAVNPPCRNTILVDPYISTFSRNTVIQAAAVISLALNYGRVWSRQVHTIAIEIPGDPTFFPNEAIRVYNTGLHDNGIYVPSNGSTKLDNMLGAIKSIYDPKQVEGIAANSNLEEDEKKVLEDALSAMVNVLEGQAKNEETKKIAQDLNVIGKPLKDLVKKTRDALQPTTDKGNLPVYQVRAIEHVIVTEGDRAGFTTKIEAIASL